MFLATQNSSPSSCNLHPYFCPISILNPPLGWHGGPLDSTGDSVISQSALSLLLAVNWFRDEWGDYIGPIRLKPKYWFCVEETALNQVWKRHPGTSSPGYEHIAWAGLQGRICHEWNQCWEGTVRKWKENSWMQVLFRWTNLAQHQLSLGVSVMCADWPKFHFLFKPRSVCIGQFELLFNY